MTNNIKQDADWYQLMIYLRTDKSGIAKDKIAYILKNNKHAYYNQTQDIEKKISN